MLMTLVSNLKDMAPFTSDPPDNYADANYAIGENYLAGGDSILAKTSYAKARNLDGLRFRASDDINLIIHKLARERGAALVDVEERMSLNSPYGIIGGEWMIDHLHPNTDGYFMIAKWICEEIKNAGFIAPQPDWLDPPPDDELKRLSGVSHFDRAYANIGVTILMNDWPFSGRSLLRNHIHPVADSAAVAVARRYKKELLDWTECREELGEFYIKSNQLPLAEREYRALTRQSPEHIPSRIKLARLLAAQFRLNEALEQIEIAHQSEPNFIPTLLEYGLIQHKRGAHKAAIKLLQRTIGLDRKQALLSTRQQVEAYFTLAAAYFEDGDSAIAQKLLTQLLEQAPSYEPARELLNRVRKKINDQTLNPQS